MNVWKRCKYIYTHIYLVVRLTSTEIPDKDVTIVPTHLLHQKHVMCACLPACLPACMIAKNQQRPLQGKVPVIYRPRGFDKFLDGDQPELWGNSRKGLGK